MEAATVEPVNTNEHDLSIAEVAADLSDIEFYGGSLPPTWEDAHNIVSKTSHHLISDLITDITEYPDSLLLAASDWATLYTWASTLRGKYFPEVSLWLPEPPRDQREALLYATTSTYRLAYDHAQDRILTAIAAIMVAATWVLEQIINNPGVELSRENTWGYKLTRTEE